ncbi:peptidase [uncultured Albimonas sp.]|uniref:peptidase n=1 Tax=uncultured Albimonas sp. TaxID=1331701 RepID=UPI0030EE4011|tara:strand:+ start:5206 stop:5943 length:738 start_codon:yes stop_codon:yes gene_type:complete
MTYCVGLRLDAGLVMLSDTRTNAGLDNISRFGKMFTWERPGERALCLMTAGNLSITQGVVTALNEACARDEAGEEVETVLNCASMFRAAQMVGEAMADQQKRYREQLEESGARSGATLILGGQRRGGRPRLFLIYDAGNFIEATEDTPFFQIGEHKYGKPILDRVITPDTPIPAALKAAFVSMDSTLRSNLSVGMPLDLAVLPAGELRFSARRRMEQDDVEFQKVSGAWSDSLKAAFTSVPEISL